MPGASRTGHRGGFGARRLRWICMHDFHDWTCNTCGHRLAASASSAGFGCRNCGSFDIVTAIAGHGFVSATTAAQLDANAQIVRWMRSPLEDYRPVPEWQLEE